jgi:hypothetical protein
MNTSECFEALRGTNPRTRAGFAQLVEAAAVLVDTQIAADVDPAPDGCAMAPRTRRRRRLVGLSTAGASLAAAAAVAALLTIGSPGGSPGVEDAAAAIKKAAAITGASAERSGTAVVRITRDGRPWAGTTIRWHGADVSVSRDTSERGRGKAGSQMLVVAGTLYGIDPVSGRWLALGSPDNIDPGTGTTPDEYLATVRADVGGKTMRKITAGVSGLTTGQRSDRSTVYRGTVPARLIASVSGFKEGQSIRVLPFGYVAHDQAADPDAPLDIAITVTAEDVIRQISVSWAKTSAWTYTVTYDGLGATPGPKAPENARSLKDARRAARAAQAPR